MRFLLTFPILAIGLTACAAGGPRTPEKPLGEQTSYNSGKNLDQALAGLTPGKPENCLPQTRTPSSDSYGRTILYRYGSNLIYRNDMGPGCERMGSAGDVMIARTPMGRFCRGDIVQLVDRTSGFPTGSCSFGDFVPYRKAR